MNNTDNLPRDEFGNIDTSKMTDLQKFFHAQEIEKQKTAEKILEEKRKLQEKQNQRAYELEAVLRKTLVAQDKTGQQLAKLEKTIESKKESLEKSMEKLKELTDKRDQLAKDIEEVKNVIDTMKGNK